jgi:hypothetical protein
MMKQETLGEESKTNFKFAGTYQWNGLGTVLAKCIYNLSPDHRILSLRSKKNLHGSYCLKLHHPQPLSLCRPV